MSFLRKRFPEFSQIIPVFAVTTLLVYSWTMYRMLQKLPSWLLYLNFWEILSNFSYALVFNFFECLLIAVLIVLLSALLPRRFFTDLFVAQGSLLSILGTAYLVYLAIVVGQSKANFFPWDVIRWAPVVGLVILVLVFLLSRVAVIRKGLEAFADRASVLLYLFIPFSLLGAIVLIVNNLF